MIPHLLFADGVIGIGIATTAVGLLVGGIAAAVARKR
jgi:mitochondrial fission 1 protein